MSPTGTRRIGEVPALRSGDPALDEAHRQVADRLNALLRRSFAQAIPLEVDLVEGLNKVGHGCGLPVPYFTHAVLPRVGALLSSAQADNPRPDRQLWVELDGAPTCKALLFLFPVVG